VRIIFSKVYVIRASRASAIAGYKIAHPRARRVHHLDAVRRKCLTVPYESSAAAYMYNCTPRYKINPRVPRARRVQHTRCQSSSSRNSSRPAPSSSRPAASARKEFKAKHVKGCKLKKLADSLEMAPLSPTGKVSKHTKETQSLGYTVTTISHLPKKSPFPLSPSCML
jgi:hypothetical protein